MELDEDEQILSEAAYKWVSRHREDIIKKFASADIYMPDTRPITVFMAGSPGAGKTEISKSFIKTFEQPPVRIDADEI